MANINKIIEHTKKWEGTLSNATTDTASKYPSPYIYKGQSGWHTNRGITYATFENASKRLGFANNEKNFIYMPDEIWLKIAKNLFWDKLYLDNMKSQALANLMFSWTWASGYGWNNRVQRYFTSKNIEWIKNDYKALPINFNALVDKYGEKKIFDELFEQYKKFYISLNQPANIKGWLNRADDLKKFSEAFIIINSPLFFL